MGKKIFSRIFIIFLFYSSLIFYGCSAFECFSPEDQVSFCLPAWPYENIPLSGWQISLFYENDIDKNSSFYINHNESTKEFLTVQLKQNSPFCITARPITLSSDGKTETLFFMPAGTVYPFLCTRENKNKGQISGFTMNLTWEDGFTATVMKSFSSSASFNWTKFSQTLHKKISDSEEYYNPWLLDKNKIYRDIEKHSFTAVNLNGKKPVILEKDALDQIFLSPFIPLNEHLIENNTVFPLWLSESPEDNRFLINLDQMILFSGSDIKKLSVQTVFLPKKYEETVYAKKITIPVPYPCSSGSNRLQKEK